MMKTAKSKKEPLEFRLHLNVLYHLGMKLYASAPSVLTELVANAWDADASEVQINIDPADDQLTVSDNGHGMSRDDVQNKFLNVGYNRREFGSKGYLSRSGKRR